MASEYISVKVPNHPFADKRGKYPVHRLVVESYLGRYLKPEEVVHHIMKTRKITGLKT